VECLGEVEERMACSRHDGRLRGPRNPAKKAARHRKMELQAERGRKLCGKSTLPVPIVASYLARMADTATPHQLFRDG